MKILIKLEHLALFILFSYFLIVIEEWYYLVYILLPDLSMVGYIFNAKIGAYLYNVVHHQMTGALFLVIPVGAMFYPYDFDFVSDDVMRILLVTGLVLLSHSNLDRVLGFGLKYTDKFKHTHLDSLE